MNITKLIKETKREGETKNNLELISKLCSHFAKEIENNNLIHIDYGNEKIEYIQNLLNDLKKLGQ